MMQDVVWISSSVRMDSVSQITGYAMDTMTVETWLMNRTVEVLLYSHSTDRHRQFPLFPMGEFLCQWQ